MRRPAPPGSTSPASRARRAGSSRTSRSSTWRRSPPPRPARVMRALSIASSTLLEAPEGAHHLGQVDGRVVDGSGDLDEGVIALPLTLACELHGDLVQEHFGTIVDANQNVFTELNDAGWTGGAFVHVARGVRVEAPIVLTAITDAAGTALHRRVLIVLEEGAEAEVWEQHLSGSTRRRDDAQLRRRAQGRPERPPALRRRAGHERALVGLRLPARRGGARRAPGLGRRRLRLGQRQGVHGDAAGRRGLARQGHRRLRPARAASTWTSTRCRSTPRRTRRPISPSAASSPTARRSSGAG